MKDYEQRLAEDWIESYSDDNPDKDSFDPLFYFEDIVLASMPTSWSLILRIIQMDKMGSSLPMLVYGPMGSWMQLYAATWIEQIEYEASINRKFRWALGGVLQGRIDETTWQRIVKTRGQQWADKSIPAMPEGEA